MTRLDETVCGGSGEAQSTQGASFTPNLDCEFDLSVVVPVRDEAETIPELVQRLTDTMGSMGLRYEVIFVTDLNRDNTVQVLRQYSRQDAHIKMLKLSNAFGQHVAVVAGLHRASGAAVVIMDGDLQDYPEDIVKLYAKLREGFDVVYGIKERKNDSALRNLLSTAFIRVLSFLSDYRMDFNTSMFRIISARVKDAVLRFTELGPSLTFIMGLVGFPTTHVLVTSGTRQRGETKYSLWRQINLAISSLIAFSTKPLRLISLSGLVVSMLSVSYFAFLLLDFAVRRVPVQGWTTIVVLLTFLGGAILFAQGITGEYIAHIFLETKKRPLYIIEESSGFPEPPTM